MRRFRLRFCSAAWFLPLGLLSWWAVPLLDGSSQLVFRDAASHYEPQYHFLRSQWLQGKFPLWNRWENGGIELAADPTYGIFYPPKLLLLLPLRWPIPYHVLLIAHWFLAWGATYYGTRRNRRSSVAAALAATAYALGGHVVSQLHNGIYLFSAAWLPVAWFGLEQWAIRGHRRSAVAAATAVAMMVLGGDPQTSVSVLLVAILFSHLRLWVPRDGRIGVAEIGRLQRRFHRWTPTARIAFVAAAAIPLAAAQWLPSTFAARESYRWLHEHPRSIWQRLGEQGRASRAEGRNDQGGLEPHWRRAAHDAQIYSFSVAPWHWCELWWPNVAGRFAPKYSRWLDTVRGEGRTWALSLYAGLVPLLAATMMLRWRRGMLRRRRSTWLVTIAAGMALGRWGLYSLLVELIPGYDLFRYPAKWWTLVAFGLALLAADGVDLTMHRTQLLRRRAAFAMVLSLLAALALAVAWPSFASCLRQAAGDPYFGQLDIRAVRQDLFGAFAHCCLVSISIVGLCTLRRLSAAWLMLLLTVIELGVANGSLVITAPRTHTQLPRSELPPGRVYRSASRLWLPHIDKQLSSAQRLQYLLEWDRKTFYGKHFLDLVDTAPSREAGKPATGSFEGIVGAESAVMPADVWLALNESLIRGERAGGIRRPNLQLLELLRVASVVAPPSRAAPPHGHFVKSFELARNAEVRFSPDRLVSTRLLPLSSIVADPRPTSRRLADHVAWIKRQFSRPRLYRVDCTEKQWQALVRRVSERSSRQELASSCRVAWSRRWSDAIEVEVATTTAALVLLPHRFSRSWIATTWPEETAGKKSERFAVVRVQGIAMGIVVPPGEHHIRLAYRPVETYLGVAVSGVSWIAAAAWLFSQLCRSRGSKRC